MADVESVVRGYVGLVRACVRACVRAGWKMPSNSWINRLPGTSSRHYGVPPPKLSRIRTTRSAVSEMVGSRI